MKHLVNTYCIPAARRSIRIQEELIVRAERRDAEDLHMVLDLVQDLLEETRRVRQQRTDSLDQVLSLDQI